MAKGDVKLLFGVSVASGDIGTTDDDYVAGEEYDVPEEKAKEFIAKGYAEQVGGTTIEVTDEERASYLGQVQAVTLGPRTGKE